MERMITYKEALKISMERYKELEKENKKLKEENEALKEWVAKGMSYKNTYNDAIPRDENGFYKEVKPTC